MVKRCKMEMLAAWLQQQDNHKLGVPSWSTLKTVLENIGKELASEIGEYDTREKTCMGARESRESRRKGNTKINSFHSLGWWTRSCEYNHNRLS